MVVGPGAVGTGFLGQNENPQTTRTSHAAQRCGGQGPSLAIVAEYSG